MTAPISYEKGYKLEIDIKQETDATVLKQMNIFHYDNVWAARNAYEKFFFGVQMPYQEEKAPEYDDKRIIMTGDEKLMVVTEIYIYRFDSVEEATKKKTLLIESYMLVISEDSRMRQEVLEMEKNNVITSISLCAEKDRVLKLSFEEMGMSSFNLHRFAHFKISTLRELHAYGENRRKMREEGGFFCDGKYLTSKMVEELLNLVKANHWEWILEELGGDEYVAN